MRKRKTAMPVLLALALDAALVGCASTPAAPVPAAASPPPTVRPSPNVYFYPMNGQSADRTDRDRYECYLWARRQTGFDPSVPQVDVGPAVQVVAMPPPGSDTLAGAATGAMIGAVVSQPWESAEGAAVGAVAGAVIGAVSDSSRQQAAQRLQEQANAQRSVAVSSVDARVLDYRRAMTACLSARGYTVQ